MTAEPAFQRVAVVVHPTRPVDNALAALARWTEEHGLDLVQLANRGETHRRVATAAEIAADDLVVALGGDGTVLSALRTAASAGTPVLGVACGSLGALTAVTAEQIADALERVWAGDWTQRSLPALAIAVEGADDDWAINDFVVVRRGGGQLAVTVTLDDEPYVRLAGDGLIVATAVGSSAYSMAAGGPTSPRAPLRSSARRWPCTAEPPLPSSSQPTQPSPSTCSRATSASRSRSTAIAARRPASASG